MREKVEVSVEQTYSDKASLKELIFTIKDWAKFFASKWFIILILGLTGAVLGLAYSFTKKPIYSAISTFVLETSDGKSGLGAYAGVASSFGIDIGRDGGLFEGENIIELYRSRRMLTKTLLTEVDFSTGKKLLIDYLADIKGYREKWNSDPIYKNIHFTADNKYSNTKSQLMHDSIVGGIVGDISKNHLKVEKKDKKLNIIIVKVSHFDENFAKAFNDALVENVNKFYLDTKTKKNQANVSILQAKADSVQRNLTGSISKAAVVADATPNQNPTRMAQRVAPIQNATVNAEVSQAVLGTLLQNLELSKISLLKETPLIQIVDKPILPLPFEKFRKLFGLVLGGMLGGITVIMYLILRKIIRDAVNS